MSLVSTLLTPYNALLRMFRVQHDEPSRRTTDDPPRRSVKQPRRHPVVSHTIEPPYSTGDWVQRGPPDTLPKLPLETIELEWRPVVTINRLPDEILSMVFEYAVGDAADALLSVLLVIPLYERLRTYANCVTSLNQVSKTWRRVCLTTPRMWTTISRPRPASMSVGNRSGSFLHDHFIALDCCLSRRGVCQLNLVLECDDPCLRVVDLLSQTGTLSSVQNLYIHNADEDVLSDLQEFDSQSTKSLTLDNCASSSSLIHTLFDSHPFLEELTIADLFLDDDDSPPLLEHTDMPRLRSLTLLYREISPDHDFHESLSAPNLERLWIYCDEPHPFQFMPSTICNVRHIFFAGHTTVDIVKKLLQSCAKCLEVVELAYLPLNFDVDAIFANFCEELPRAKRFDEPSSVWPALRQVMVHRGVLSKFVCQWFLQNRRNLRAPTFTTLGLSDTIIDGTVFRLQSHSILVPAGVTLATWKPPAVQEDPTWSNYDPL